MATTTDLNTLKINYLSQEQYDAAVSGGTINENELYLTPADGVSDVKVDGVSVVTDNVAEIDLTDKVGSWTLAGRVTGGTDTVTIPSTAKEICACVDVSNTSYTAMVVADTIQSRWEIGGYYLTSNDYGLCNLNVSNNGRTFQIRNARFAGQDYKSTAVLKIYYR